MKVSEKKGGSVGFIIGLTVSALILFTLASSLDLKKFAATLASADIIYLPLYLLLALFLFWIRAIRWQLLLPSHLSLSINKLAYATIVGTFASCVLPLRAGEFVRPWVLSRWQPVSFAMGFASIVTERVFDVLAMMVFLVAVLNHVDNAPFWVGAAAKALGSVALVIALIMVLAYTRPASVLRYSEGFLDFLFGNRKPELRQKLGSMSAEFIGGLRSISSVRELILIVLWSLVLWFFYSVMYQIMLLSLHQSASLWEATAVNVFVALAVAAPSAPGFLGTFQLGCIVALTYVYGHTEEFSLAYSVLAHVLQVVPTVIVALIILKKEGLNFNDIRNSRSAAIS